jgi:hypothetical protein
VSEAVACICNLGYGRSVNGLSENFWCFTGLSGGFRVFFPVSSSYRQLSSGITAFFKATHTSILTYILFFLNFLAVFVLL